VWRKAGWLEKERRKKSNRNKKQIMTGPREKGKGQGGKKRGQYIEKTSRKIEGDLNKHKEEHRGLETGKASAW